MLQAKHDSQRPANSLPISAIANTQFPKRLTSIVGSMFTTDSDGRMVTAGFEANSPIDAEVRRASITLSPINGKWLVTTAAMPLAHSIEKGVTMEHQIVEASVTVPMPRRSTS